MKFIKEIILIGDFHVEMLYTLKMCYYIAKRTVSAMTLTILFSRFVNRPFKASEHTALVICDALREGPLFEFADYQVHLM